MNDLSKKISKSNKIILDAISRFPKEKLVIAWTGGKDSTVVLHLIKTLCNDTIPFPIMFNDSTMEFPEIYAFIKKLTREWHLNLIIVPHRKNDLKTFHKLTDSSRQAEVSRLMKIHAMNAFIEKFKPQGLMSGIRWDEHTSRSQESYFSERKDHVRIHPILHFNEQDIWDYIHTLDIPYVPLYDQGYRSLGEKPFTQKAKPGDGERSGREPDKEQMMEKLRQMGYW